MIDSIITTEEIDHFFKEESDKKTEVQEYASGKLNDKNKFEKLVFHF